MKYLIACLILLPLISLAQQNITAVNNLLRVEIKKALNDKTNQQVCCKVIPDKDIAVAVAEIILFKIYGRDQITSEKPYDVNLIDGYWRIEGSLPPDRVGGTFLIILSAKNGRVIKLTHGK
jgi:hypothetical protein